MPTQTNQYTGNALVPALEIHYALAIAIAFVPASTGTTYLVPKGAGLAESVATPGNFGLYDSTNTDLSVCKGLSEYDFYINDAGYALFSPISTFGAPFQNGSMFIRGYFRLGDLKLTTGAGKIDANAITNLTGRIISGTLAAGIGILAIS